MEKFAYKMEDMLREKLGLYKEIRQTLEEEKKAVVDMDIDSLWAITDRKKDLASRIKKIRQRMLHLIEEKGVRSEMDVESFRLSRLVNLLPVSSEKRSRMNNIRTTIDGEKDEVARLASESKQYVNDYLAVVDDIMGTMVSSAEGKDRYDCYGNVRQGQHKTIIRGEV